MSLVLYRGTPPWGAVDGASHAFPAITDDIEAEIVIVGAGITGALLAYRLAKDGVGAVVVDRLPPAMGSTYASTALLSYEMDEHLVDLIPRYGDRDAARVYELGRAAIGRIGKIAADLATDVDYRPRPCFFLARTDEEADDLHREYECRRAHGFDIEFLDRAAVERQFGFTRPAATRTPEAAEVDPVKLTRAALDFAARLGARFFTGTVEQSRAEAGGVTLALAGGRHIRARQAVFATGYETTQFLDLPAARLTSTYVLATDPVPRIEGWPDRAMICEAGDPYTYLRRMPDDRVMIGGEDEDFSDADAMRAALPAKIEKLAGMLAKMFPTANFDIQSAWAGVFSATGDGLPFIGAHRGYPRTLFALGYGGNGITAAATAADLIADALAGRPSDDARLFRFGR